MNVDNELNWVGPGTWPHVECPLALVKDGADESRGVGLLPVQGQSEACVDLVLLQILKDEVWSDVKRVSETHCVLPGVGVVKEGFPDSGPHLGQLSNHPYNCVLDTRALHC